MCLVKKGVHRNMNKIFKVVWSKTKECYVVVSEVAKNNGGKKKVLASVLAGLAIMGAAAQMGTPVQAGTDNRGSAVNLWADKQLDGTTPNTANTVGANSVAIGNNLVAGSASTTPTGRLGGTAIAIGVDSQAKDDRDIAIGYNNTTEGQDSFAMGSNVIAGTGQSIAIGSTNTDAKTGAQTQTIARGKVTMKNGRPEPAAAIAIGVGAQALDGSGVLAMGQLAKAVGNNDVAIGTQTKVEGNNSTAIGSTAQALGNSSAAYGTQAIANGLGATAVGPGANAGTGSDAAEGATAVGRGAKAIKEGASALGWAANASVTNAAAIGRDTTANIEGGVALGYQSKTTTAAGVQGYNPASDRTNKYSTQGGAVGTSTLAAVSVGNGTTATRQITGLAAGTEDTDAVNVAQLKNVNLKYAGDTGNSDVLLKDGTLNIKGDDKFISTSADANGVKITAKVGENITTNTDGKAVAPTTNGIATTTNVTNAINNSGWKANASANGGTLTGSATATKVVPGDTVTFSAGKNLTVAQTLGTNTQQYTYGLSSTLKDIESIQNGASKITLNNGGGTTISGGNLSVDGNKITNLAPGTDDSDAVNYKQLKAAKTVVKGGTNVTVDKGTGANGEDVYTVNATAGGTASTESVVKKAAAAGDTNIADVSVAGGKNVNDPGAQYEVSVSKNAVKDAAREAVTVNNGGNTDNPITVSPTDDAAIHNTTYAVTFDGDKAAKQIPLTYKANGSGDKTVKLDKGLDFTNGTNTTAEIGNDGVVKFNLKDNIALTNAGSLTVGDTKVNNDGLTISGGPSVTKNGIDAGNQKITNVAPGTISNTSTDAVNGSQLYDVDQKFNNTVKLTGNAGATDGQALNKANGLSFGVIGADNGKYISTSANGSDVTVDLSTDAKKLLNNTVEVKGKNAATVTTSTETTADGGTKTIYTVDVANTGTVAKSSWNIKSSADTANGGAEATGHEAAAKNIADTNKVEMVAGKNLTVKQTSDTDGAKVEFALNKDLKDLTSVTSEKVTTKEIGLQDTAGKVTTIKNDGDRITYTKDGDTKVHKVATLDDEKHIKPGSYAVQNDGSVTMTYVDGNGDPVANDEAKITGIAKQDLSNIDNAGKQVITGLGTVVKAGDNVTVSEASDATTGQKTYTVNAVTPAVYTTPDGEKLTKDKDGKFHKVGETAEYTGDIITSFENPKAAAGQTTKDGGMIVNNVGSAIKNQNPTMPAGQTATYLDKLKAAADDGSNVKNAAVNVSDLHNTAEALKASELHIAPTVGGKDTDKGGTTVTPSATATAAGAATQAYKYNAATKQVELTFNDGNGKAVTGPKAVIDFSDLNTGGTTASSWTAKTSAESTTAGAEVGKHVGDTSQVINDQKSVDFQAGRNMTVKQTNDSNGNTTINYALDKDLTNLDKVVVNGENGTNGKDGVTIVGPQGATDAPGIPGTNGIDGKVGITGKDGKDAVSIAGKDGVGTIGLTGPQGPAGTNGKSVDISTENGTKTLVKPEANNNDQSQRIVYVPKDANGNPLKDADNNDIKREVATMDDGLKFAGDDGQTNANKVIAKQLNQQVDIIGGATGTLTDNNIGVNNDNGKLKVQLAKDVNLTPTGSLTTGDTKVNNDGITIKAPTPAAGATPTTDVKLTNTGLDNGGNKITNVAEGTNNTDAVNVKQLKENRTEVKAGDNVVVTTDVDATDNHTIYTVNAVTPAVYTTPNGEKLTKDKDGKFHKVGETAEYTGDIITSFENPKAAAGQTTKDGGMIVNNIGSAIKNQTPTMPAGQTATYLDKLKAAADDNSNVKNAAVNVSDLHNTAEALKASELHIAPTAVKAGSTEAKGGVVNGTENVYKYDAVTKKVTLTYNDGNGKAVTDTKAVIDFSDLNVPAGGNNYGFKANATANGGTVEGTATETAVENGGTVNFAAGKNLTVKQDIDTTNKSHTYTYALADEVSVGEKAQPGVPGKDGKDGSIGATGKDGSSVVLNGKDGSIGMTGPKGQDGKDGINGRDGADISITSAKGEQVLVNRDPAHNGDTDKAERIVYVPKDANGNPIQGADGKNIVREVATMDDGLRFTGNNTSTENKQKLGSLVKVQGEGTKEGADATGAKEIQTSDGTKFESAKDNIAVEADGANTLTVKLNKDLKGLDSVTTKEVKLGDANDNISIKKAGDRITYTTPGSTDTHKVATLDDEMHIKDTTYTVDGNKKVTMTYVDGNGNPVAGKTAVIDLSGLPVGETDTDMRIKEGTYTAQNGKVTLNTVDKGGNPVTGKDVVIDGINTNNYVAGDNVTLTPDTDAAGKPVVKINAALSTEKVVKKAGADNLATVSTASGNVAGDKGETYEVAVTKGDIENNAEISYKANGGTAQKTTLANGFNFTSDDNSVAITTGANGKVNFKVDTTGIQGKAFNLDVDKEGTGKVENAQTVATTKSVEKGTKFVAGNNLSIRHDAINGDANYDHQVTYALNSDLQGITSITKNGGATMNFGPNEVSITGGNLSMGNGTNNNKIVNVAPGTDKSDVATVGQLTKVTSNDNTVAINKTTDADGAPVYDLSVQGGGHDPRVDQLGEEIGRVGAQGAALAALKPIQYDPLEPTQIMAGYGNYRGNSAIAMGVAHYKNESTLMHAGVSWAGGSRHMMANAGVTWKVGNRDSEAAVADRYRKGPISSAYAMQQEMASVKAQNAGLKTEVSDLKAENEQMKAQIAAMMAKLGM